MFRCTNENCRASLEFNVPYMGHLYRRTNTFGANEMKLARSGKREGTIEDCKSHVMKCTTCGHKDLVKNMMAAYNDPMKYFDTDNLCNCGGEIWNDFELKKPSEESTKEFDGDQRTVSLAIKKGIFCERCKKEYFVKDGLYSGKE